MGGDNHVVGGADEEREIPQAIFLRLGFGLSLAEARFVLLFAGASARFSAEARGIRYETIRGHLKSVFQKTGTHRQSELVLTVFQAIERSRSFCVS